MFKMIIIAAGAFVLAFGNHAKAADLYKPDIPKEVTEAVTPTEAKYKTGLYVFGSVGVGIADVSSAAISFADESLTYGIGGGFDIVAGSLLFGPTVTAEWNDSSDPMYQVGGRAGILLSPHMLVYMTGGWALADFSTDVSGWYIGGGPEFLVNDHLAIAGEYVRTDYGSKAGVDTVTHAVKVKGIWRF